MTQTIEQLQAKVAELEEENARLNLLFVKAAKGKGENLKECFSLRQQLAAAILKATGPLEKEIERLKTVPMKYKRMAFNAQLQDENNELRTQLAAVQEEMNEWRNQAHQSQSAFDRLQDQLAKAEQRVVEAIVDMLQQKHRNCFGAHSVSAKLFAEHIAYPLESLVERVTSVCKAKLNGDFGTAEAMKNIENILLSGESRGQR